MLGLLPRAWKSLESSVLFLLIQTHPSTADIDAVLEDGSTAISSLKIFQQTSNTLEYIGK